MSKIDAKILEHHHRIEWIGQELCRLHKERMERQKEMLKLINKKLKGKGES